MEKDFLKYKDYTNNTFNKYYFEWTKKINLYKNKEGKKCLNEFEKQKKIGEGSSWRVYLVKRYFYDENKKINSKLFALKKAFITVLYKRRYYKDNKLSNYFEKLLTEIEIMGILNQKDEEYYNEYFLTLYELIYDNEGENKYSNIYVITDYCSIGTLMNRDNINFNHYHNPLLIKYFYPEIKLEHENIEDISESENLNLIKKNSISLNIKHILAKKLFKQILEGVKYMHKLNIVHRDIKIENILFDDKSGKIKFIDFSISTILKKDQKLINEPGGSMHYQSPEFFNTENNDGYYDPFIADIWAVGICLYIFIFEEFPFDSESELELGIKISEKEYKFPFDPENKNFEKIIEAMLHKDINNRITDIDKLLNFDYFKDV